MLREVMKNSTHTQSEVAQNEVLELTRQITNIRLNDTWKNVENHLKQYLLPFF